MMRDWRNIMVGTWFATRRERINAEGVWVQITYAITSITKGYVDFRETHDHTKVHRETIGWVIDNGHEIF
jgi:hypothetical protein